MNSTVKHLLIWVLTVGVLLMGWKFVTMNMSNTHDTAISESQMQNDIDGGKVTEITVNGSEVSGVYKEAGKTFHTVITPNFMDRAEEAERVGYGFALPASNNALVVPIVPKVHQNSAVEIAA